MNRNSNITQFVKESRSEFRRWEIRDNAETRKLSSSDRQLVIDAISRHNQRVERGNWQPVTTRKDFVAILTAQVQAEVQPMIKRLYRTNVSGHTTITVKIGAPAAGGYTTNNWNVYSKNTTYPGHDAKINVTVMHGWRRQIASVEGLATAGGMLTTHARNIETNVWEATWITQGRGVDLNINTGYIATDGNEWTHAETADAAKKLLVRRQRAAQRAAAAKSLQFNSVSQLIERYGSLLVTVSDSNKAGNCETGTKNFIERFFPGRNSATVAEVLGVNVQQTFAIKACLVAIARQIK